MKQPQDQPEQDPPDAQHQREQDPPAARHQREQDPPAARHQREQQDDALMLRFCAGDEDAFDSLYRRYGAPVHAYIRRMVGQHDVADDVLQVTFLSLVRSRGRYERGTSVRAWLFAIAANATRDFMRRAKMRTRHAAIPAEEPHTEPSLPDPPAVRAVQAALGELVPEQREAVLMHQVHGLSFAEIAEALGISESAAKVRAHRGYEKLRGRLSALEGSS